MFSTSALIGNEIIIQYTDNNILWSYKCVYMLDKTVKKN